ncbi:MAG TPA: universal stress protein [Acidimicrobiales bacterium]|nr:universal stress protein [Acidimicrobiales bacterium]
MSKIIAAIDNSAASRPVLAMARAVALALDASLEVLHVVEDGDETARAAAQASGVPLRTLTGDPMAVLSTEMDAEDVSVLVIGARGRPAGRRPAGHLVMSLATRSDKPIVVVPPQFQPPDHLSTVLVAMEGTPGKARALQRTIEVSLSAGLQIAVIHVQDENHVPSFSDQVQHETEAYAKEFLARHKVAASGIRLELRVGDPATELLSAAQSEGADLVAVGWPHSDDPNRGAVAREILNRSPIAVLLMALS